MASSNISQHQHSVWLLSFDTVATSVGTTTDDTAGSHPGRGSRVIGGKSGWSAQTTVDDDSLSVADANDFTATKLWQFDLQTGLWSGKSLE